ncbi:MAG: hypothetical protein H0V89_01935 [Deltaproteobacteria bacterium]|nr:hypothetical protein [Deltaproteobacteria bacterium]
MKLLVARGPGEARATPSAVTLQRDRPLPGDRWSPSRDAERGSQLTAMEHRVGIRIANGQDLALFGDNLVLELALDAANLPIGGLVRVGGALLEVTSKPHNGCKKYAARFGLAALAWISVPTRRPLRLRGIHFRVAGPGRVAVGDPVKIVSRGPAAGPDPSAQESLDFPRLACAPSPRSRIPSANLGAIVGASPDPPRRNAAPVGR